ncbi:MAG TPA: hypothetical protein VKA08_02900 [Balneolales bacterium]|nr:hypothetical protein [Balneolales bacterium]
MRKQNNNTGKWVARTNKRTIQLAYWTTGWVVTMALATFGPKFLWHSNELLTLLAILINLGFGIGMIMANIRYLKVLDEMMQKIQLEAMGLSLGIGVVCGLSYSLLDTTNLISSDAEISYLIILMSLTYLAGIFTGHRRYR